MITLARRTLLSPALTSLCRGQGVRLRSPFSSLQGLDRECPLLFILSWTAKAPPGPEHTARGPWWIRNGGNGRGSSLILTSWHRQAYPAQALTPGHCEWTYVQVTSLSSSPTSDVHFVGDAHIAQSLRDKNRQHESIILMSGIVEMVDLR